MKDDDDHIKELYRLWTRDKAKPTFAELVLDDKTLYRKCVIEQIETAQELLNRLPEYLELLRSSDNTKQLQVTIGNIFLSLQIAVRTLKKLKNEKFFSDQQIQQDHQTITNIRDDVLKFIEKENLHGRCNFGKEELQS